MKLMYGKKTMGDHAADRFRGMAIGEPVAERLTLSADYLLM